MASATVRAANASTKVWHTVDASGMVVGRLAQHVAKLLQGKNKPIYTPGADCGDYVVILNADKVKFSGRKATDKMYYWHTGFPGGLKQRTAAEMFEKAPDRILRRAIKGMLPKNRMTKSTLLRRLRIEASESNKWASQCVSTAAGAPAYAAASKPPASVMGSASASDASDELEIPFLRHHISVSDPEGIDVDAMREETLEEPDFGLLRTVFEDVWQKEVDFWAARDEVVPEDIYDKHGLAFPGDGAAPMAAADAAEAVTAQARAYWEEVGKQQQQDALDALAAYKAADGGEWKAAPERS